MSVSQKDGACPFGIGQDTNLKPQFHQGRAQLLIQVELQLIRFLRSLAVTLNRHTTAQVLLETALLKNRRAPWTRLYFFPFLSRCLIDRKEDYRIRLTFCIFLSLE